MQMIEVDDVVMLELGSHQQVADDTCIVGNLYANGIFDCPHRGQSMGVRSDPAGALHEMMCIPGIPSLQESFQYPGTSDRNSRR